MVVYSIEIGIETDNELQLVDITLQVRNAVKKAGVKTGLVNVFVPGATGAITTMEFEPRLVEDTIALLKRLIPKDAGYKHDFQDDNAHSHLRASLLSPEITIPINNREPILGTWQQVVFIELDTRGRERKVIITVTGEK
ncbi:MAG: YjbQ family protein [Candidatus Gerdarchaeota archaeon]|nr:MAG: YjbQ family protein [Candidatus Gerdarchaeota archaeon]RLI68755.1 MAG: YjbQ family protein [Candidatus Gerdarchaeota archaeon]